MRDILNSIQITTALPELVHKLEDAVSTIVNFATKYGHGGSDLRGLLEAVLTMAWEGYPMEFTTDSSGNVRAGLIEIQSHIRTEVQEPFQNVTDAIHALEQTLGAFPIKTGQFSLKAGVASYQRWSTVSMDLPCTRQKRAHYEVAGYKGSFDYPGVLLVSLRAQEDPLAQSSHPVHQASSFLSHGDSLLIGV